MNIFISYRRADTQDFVGRLADRLRRTRGIADVFLDVDDIAVGESFEARIMAALGACAVSLIVIGRGWRGVSDNGVPRIFHDEDFVRAELREALKSRTVILPVLANEAAMPQPEDLPEDIRAITALNAFSVRHGDFERDFEHLLDAIFARKRPGRVGAFLRRNPILTGVLSSVAGATAALVLLVIVLAILNATNDLALSDVTGGEGEATLTWVAIAALGAALPWLLRRRKTTHL